MIIGLSGKMRSGKTTLANMVAKRDSRFVVMSFALKVKRVAHVLTGISMVDLSTQSGKGVYLPDWGMTVGELLQKIGTDGIRNGVHRDAWVMALMQSYVDGLDRWVIDDVRFPNEHKSIKDMGGVVVRLNRSLRDLSGRDENHESEIALDGAQFDLVFNNDGSMAYLKKFADELVERYG